MKRYSDVMELARNPGFESDYGGVRLGQANFGRLLEVCDFSWGVIRATAFGSFLTVMVTTPDREKARSLLKDLLRLCLHTDERIRGAIAAAMEESSLPPAPPMDLAGFMSGMREMGCGMTRLGVEVTKDMLLMLPWSWMNFHQFLALASGICRLLPPERHKAVVLGLLAAHESNVDELSETLESKALADGPTLDMAAKWAASVDEWLKSGGCMPFVSEEAGVLKAVTERFGAPWAVPGAAPV